MITPITYLFGQPLKNYSTIRIGGIARKIAVISDEEQLSAAILDLPFVVIGNGSNVLFSDNGYDGQIILLKNAKVEINGDILTAGAGVSLVEISKLCQKSSLAGFEWASGIPSSVGGAVYMNAGAHGGSISDILLSCKVLRGRKVVELTGSECGFNYRTSIFKDNGDIILSTKFLLHGGTKEDISRRMQEYTEIRRNKQPRGLSLGSVFKNPDKAAGYYIEQAGLKGRSVGDLIVSEKHANFIINKGSGTAKDFLTLVEIIKGEVHKRFGVTLNEEFIRIGEF